MYKVEIHVQEKGRKEKKETFVIGDIDSSAYHDEMNAVSDYLYGLDIPFDVDADGDMMIELKRTVDILAELKKIRKPEQIICGFSMETQNLLENSRSKLERKGLDMICANSLREDGAGFGGDTNVVTIITEDDEMELGKLSKFDTAMAIIDKAKSLRKTLG